MDLYAQTSYELSRLLTLKYSTSFGQSSKLFSPSIQLDIYAIYGLVRIADEIVDTYPGKDKAEQLALLESETLLALRRGYSTNPIVHAFALTANKYDITKPLISPFFESMRMDLKPTTFTQSSYKRYIYGSAEVIGLMCLKVFCQHDADQYKTLKSGAQSLGAAYQKINFLRDIASDFHDRHRMYFPGTSFDSFDESQKNQVIHDIKKDLDDARQALNRLPATAAKAVRLSFIYYSELLKKLEHTPVEKIKTSRIRISDARKARLFLRHSLTRKARA